MSIESKEVLSLVARLVVGYLDEQHLPEAHKTFCETSRHLTEDEYLAFTQGVRTLDTSIGLVNIVMEYFYIKNKLNDFIRNCPKTSLIIKLIDTNSFLLRLDLIFKVLRENIQKFEKKDAAPPPPPQSSEARKRRHNEDELFNISNTNTSTPETVAHCSKRPRVSFSKPLITLSANKTDAKVKVDDEHSQQYSLAKIGKKELNYISSPETSNKEDDVSEEEDEEIEEEEEEAEGGESSSKMSVPPPELLSETVLRKTDFVENLAEIINRTRTAKELEQSLEPSSSPKPLTDNDFQEIISKTENDFEDILSEVIGKYLGHGESRPTSAESSVVTQQEEVPIKQRLRPRAAKKPQPISEKKKKKSPINIISNEIYSGPLPLCLQLPSTSTPNIVPVSVSATSIVSHPPPSNQIIYPEPIETQPPHSLVVNLVPISLPQLQPTTTTATFIPLSTFSTAANIVCESSAMNVELPQNVQIILSPETSQAPAVETIIEGEVAVESVQQTPKVSIPANFLASKCKSTPRRKASHIRILDFNQTPSANRLAAIKEFQTPNSSGIRMETPGSAPASITVTKMRKVEEKKTVAKEEAKENLDVSLEIVDESSNSNSISHTPKVAKNRRRRKIEIDAKTERPHEEESPKPMTREEWLQMRAEQKAMSVDDRMRILFQQQNEQQKATAVKKRKTPKKKPDPKKQTAAKLKSKQPVVALTHQGKKLLCAKFKVTSPRKAALLKKTPKKKKAKLSPIAPNKIIVNAPYIGGDEKKAAPASERNTDSVPKLIDTPVTEVKTESESSDLNRSDTVQEVANLLTNLPETILAKTNSFEQVTHVEMIDQKILMETPLKLDSMSPLPNTPRFAVPLVSMHQETPLTKIIASTVPTALSSLKVCDILTPSFPITPGFKETPLKSDPSPGTASASGYSSRRTDYSSCSSYYKPDESEEINQNLEMIIKQSRGSERDRNSQSESDGGVVVVTEEVTVREKVILGSAKKIECPGALERVQSFGEEAKNIPMPHYTMMDEEGLLSESMLTTASDETSSSFTCSTCSTDPSSDENTLDLLNKSENLDDRDSEWQCEDIEIEKEVSSNKSLVDEKTGEVRFPLRNWLTPKKIEPEPPKVDEAPPSSQPIIEEPQQQQQKEEEKKKKLPDLEAIKQRTLKIIKSESAVNARRVQPKLKKSNAKTFKLPPEQPKVVALTRREQILQQNLSERPRPTPLKLISTAAHPSMSSSSSSRRKNATPRKTIIIDELPKAPSPTKRTRVKSKSQERKKAESTGSAAAAKTPIKPESVSLENITDNAVSHDDHPSLNISTSFNESSEEEENTVVVKPIPKVPTEEEGGSNTFQRTLIAQGFDKQDAKDLQAQLVDKIEQDQKREAQAKEEEKSDAEVKEKKPEPKTESEDDANEEEDDDEDECEFALADVIEKSTFAFSEPENFKASKDTGKPSALCPASKLQIDGKIIKIDFDDPVDIFTMEPAAAQDTKPKEEAAQKTRETPKPESKILTKEIEIDKILTLIHGKH